MSARISLGTPGFAICLQQPALQSEYRPKGTRSESGFDRTPLEPQMISPHPIVMARVSLALLVAASLASAAPLPADSSLALMPIRTLAADTEAGSASQSAGDEVIVERGDLRLAISQLRTGLSPRDLRSPARRGEVPWARVAVRITQGEQPTGDWGLASLAIPHGKSSVWKANRCVTGFTTPGEGYFAFPAPPTSVAFPWRARVEVARAPRGISPDFTRGFAPAELWTLPGLPIPARKSYTRLARRGTKTSRANGMVKLLAVAGPGTKPPQGVLHRDAVPSVQFCIDPSQPDLRVTLLRATDFYNRIVPLTGEAEGKTEAGRILALGLRPNRKSRVLNLVVAVQHARRFEVRLAPSRAAGQ